MVQGSAIAMFRSFLDALEEGVLFLDAGRRVLVANGAAAQMVQYESASILVAR